MLRSYQLRAIDQLRYAILEGNKRIVLTIPTGGGKCLGIGTKVVTYTGKLVNVEDLRPGDKLMGPDSAPRTVLSTVRDLGKLYRIVPVKGDPWVCNDVHILTLVHTETGELVDIGLQEYLAKSKWWKHCHKLTMPPGGVDFPDKPPLPIDPYLLGVWFGDGSKSLRTFCVTKPDIEIRDLMQQTAKDWGLRCREYVDKRTQCPSYFIVGEGHVSNPFLDTLRDIVEDPTIIPEVIRTSSREERLKFLAGIIDTDGYIHHGFAEVIQKHKGIADGLAFIARSLGFKVTSRVKIVKGVEYQRLNILGDLSVVPNRVSRKKSSQRLQVKSAVRTGFSVEPIECGEYAGFELDGDGRFLLEDFTITHNTLTAAHIISAALKKGRKVQFVVHLRELVEQTIRALNRCGVERIGVIRGDDGRVDPDAPVQVASIQTLARRKRPEANIIFLDECHRSIAPMYRKAVWEAYPDALIIGLTATPCRTDGRPLGQYYEKLIVAATYSELIEGGFISEPIVYAPTVEPDLSGVRIVGGDYDDGQLETVMTELAGEIVPTWRQKADGLRTVVFATSINHSKDIVARFVADGVVAEHLDGTTPSKEREAILSRWASGQTTVVSNVGVLTEGFDLPAIRCAVLARPTQSLVLFMQTAGRALRAGETRPVILDHAGNVGRFGLPTEDRTWIISGRAKQEVPRSPFTPCKQCFAYIKRTLAKCPFCGAERVKEEREIPVERKASFEQKDRVSIERDFYLSNVYLARAKGFKPGFAAFKFKEKFGRWPPYAWNTETKTFYESDGFWRDNQRAREAAAKSLARDDSVQDPDA